MVWTPHITLPMFLVGGQPCIISSCPGRMAKRISYMRAFPLPWRLWTKPLSVEMACSFSQFYILVP